MSELKKLQSLFAEAVYREDESLLKTYIKEGTLESSDKFSIYHDNVFITLRNNLSAKFPLVSKLVDARFFAFMAHEYVKAYPSKSGNLDDFGESFSLFIKGFDPVKPYPYLTDIANLEWAIHFVSMVDGDAEQIINSNYALDQILDVLTNDSDFSKVNLEQRKVSLKVVKENYKIRVVVESY